MHKYSTQRAALSGFAMALLMSVQVKASAQSSYSNGLTQEDRSDFYHMAEGSEVIPLSWIKSLKNKKTDKYFLEDIERFGLIPDPNNKYGLPVGLTADETRDIKFTPFGKMVGVNCAACHVSELKYDGQSVRVDGAPSRFDIEKFFDELGQAIKDTLADKKERWKFLGRVVKFSITDTTASKPVTFSSPTSKLLAYPGLAEVDRISSPREEAIRNKLDELAKLELSKESVDLSDNFIRRTEDEIQSSKFSEYLTTKGADVVPLKIAGTPYFSSFEPKTEKVSIPGFNSIPVEANSIVADISSTGAFDAIKEAIVVVKLLKSRADFILSRVAGPNFEHVKALGGRVDAFGNARNIVFPKENALPPVSPVSFPHLWGLKDIAWLHWDGNTNSVMERNMGQAIGLGAIVNKANYASTLLPKNIFKLEILARKIQPPIWPSIFPTPDSAKVSKGKELFDANCATCHAAKVDEQPDVEIDLAEILTDSGRAKSFAIPVAEKSGSVPQSKAIGKVLKNVKERAYLDNKVGKEQAKAMEWGKDSVWRTTKKYSARSLAGVWATAPYLHNNSVPTISDLLKPEDKRPTYFIIEDNTYDVKNLGLKAKTAHTPSGLAEGNDSKVFDTTIEGNKNTGHEYGTQLNDEEKESLIEFLKTI